MDNPNKEIQFKKCNRCGLVKPLRKFGKSKQTKDGLQYYCKKCCSKVRKAYRRGKSAKVKDYNAKILYDMMRKRGFKTLDGSNKILIRNFCKKTGAPYKDPAEILGKILRTKEGQKYFEDNGLVKKTITYTRNFKSIKIKDQKK